MLRQRFGVVPTAENCEVTISRGRVVSRSSLFGMYVQSSGNLVTLSASLTLSPSSSPSVCALSPTWSLPSVSHCVFHYVSPLCVALCLPPCALCLPACLPGLSPTVCLTVSPTCNLETFFVPLCFPNSRKLLGFNLSKQWMVSRLPSSLACIRRVPASGKLRTLSPSVSHCVFPFCLPLVTHLEPGNLVI